MELELFPRMRPLLLALSLLLCPVIAEASVTRLQIDRREVVLNGRPFGAAGPYEKLSGKVYFALDPALPQNAIIVDLNLAPKNAQGLVEFSADFYLLKPVDPARGNGRLFYEAGNRGTKRILPVFQNAANSADPSTSEEFGNGALMQQGFTLLWMGWQWDVPEGRMRMDIPIATDNGKPITGWVRGNFIPGVNLTSALIADRGHQPYPVVDPASAEHRLLVRTLPTDPPREIARATWRFTGPGTITADRGFEAGLIYDVVYRARDPRVVGAGLAGTRDIVSFFKHATAAEGNPTPGITHAIGWGVSQTGRFLRHFVYQGFNEDERGRSVFDGADRSGRRRRPRLVQPSLRTAVTRSAAALQHPLSGGHVSVHRRRSTDPETGLTDGLLARATRSNTVPKFFHLLTDSEYFNRAGSLVHTDVTGTRDVPPPPTSRIYFIASAPHIVGAFPPAPFGDAGLQGPREHEPARLHDSGARAVPRARSLDRRRRRAAAEPLSAAGRWHAGRGRRAGLAHDSRLQEPAVTDDDVSAGLRTGVDAGHRLDRAAADRQGVRRARAGGGRSRQHPRRHPAARDQPCRWPRTPGGITATPRSAQRIGSRVRLDRTCRCRGRARTGEDGRQRNQSPSGTSLEDYLGRVSLARTVLLAEDLPTVIERARSHYQWATR